mgnify:FL=1
MEVEGGALRRPEPWVAVHELGHVVDATLDFGPESTPLNAYAATNRQEAFAAAFEARYTPAHWQPDWRRNEITAERLAAISPQSVALFEEIER